MGLFDKEYIVEYEYSDGFLFSYKKGVTSITESNEYSAKRKAKEMLEGTYKYVHIVSVYSKIDKERQAREQERQLKREQRELEEKRKRIE